MNESQNKAQTTVLITGASGFIGTSLVEDALTRGMNVLAAVRPTSSRKYLQDKRITLVELDFLSIDALTERLREITSANGSIDYIVHNAGITKARKVDDYFEVNTRYTRNFLEALVKSNITPAKFVLMSSLAAYGPGNSDTMVPINSGQTPAPVTAYGRSKLQAEQILKSQRDIPWMIIRPTAVFGPREKEIFALFRLIKLHLHPWIKVSNQRMSFIYVKDLARAVLDAVVSPLSDRAYFISDGQAYKGDVFGKYVKKALGKKAPDIAVSGNLMKIIARILETTGSILGRTPGLNVDKAIELSSKNWVCDISAAVTDLNFKPLYSLENAIQETVNWYKAEGWL